MDSKFYSGIAANVQYMFSYLGVPMRLQSLDGKKCKITGVFTMHNTNELKEAMVPGIIQSTATVYFTCPANFQPQIGDRLVSNTKDTWKIMDLQAQNPIGTNLYYKAMVS